MSILRDHITTEYDRLFNYTMALTKHRQNAEDLLSEAVVRMLEFEDRYVEQGTFVAWAMHIIRNCLFDKSRHKKRHARYEEFCKILPQDVQPIQNNVMFMHDVEKALALLSPQNRMIVMDVMIKGFSYEEVAAARGISMGTVKSRLWRAREALARAYYGATTEAPVQKMPEAPAPVPIIVRVPKPVLSKKERGRPVNAFSKHQAVLRHRLELEAKRAAGGKVPGRQPVRKVKLVPGKLLALSR